MRATNLQLIWIFFVLLVEKVAQHFQPITSAWFGKMFANREITFDPQITNRFIPVCFVFRPCDIFNEILHGLVCKLCSQIHMHTIKFQTKMLTQVTFE